MVDCTEHDIQNLLFAIGLPANQLGFLYLTYGMSLVLTDYEYATRVSKLLYVDIASRYKTEPQSVERCIRHAINAACDGDRSELMGELFDSSKKTPSPTEFISRVYFYIINSDNWRLTKKEA